jgi:hypothetical protein
MCQCGCGEFGVAKAFRLPDGKVVAYGIYRGCRDCFNGPGISIYVYPDDKSEWLEGVKIQPYTPNEYGGVGIPISFFEVSDLIAAAKKLGGIELEEEGYHSFDEWLDENGLRMMQDGMKIFDKRTPSREDK